MSRGAGRLRAPGQKILLEVCVWSLVRLLPRHLVGKQASRSGGASSRWRKERERGAKSRKRGFPFQGGGTNGRKRLSRQICSAYSKQPTLTSSTAGYGVPKPAATAATQSLHSSAAAQHVFYESSDESKLAPAAWKGSKKHREMFTNAEASNFFLAAHTDSSAELCFFAAAPARSAGACLNYTRTRFVAAAAAALPLGFIFQPSCAGCRVHLASPALAFCSSVEAGPSLHPIWLRCALWLSPAKRRCAVLGPSRQPG